MSVLKDDPFEVVVEQEADDLSALTDRPLSRVDPEQGVAFVGAATARFSGFDLDDRPLLLGLSDLPGELVPARTTTTLRPDQIGSTVVLVFEHGDVRRPIVIGVLQDRSRIEATASPQRPAVSVQVDDDRLVLTAEREVVLRCGSASITLTRAGKVLIKGAYVLSRSSGYNRIKGAAVDIN